MRVVHLRYLYSVHQFSEYLQALEYHYIPSSHLITSCETASTSMADPQNISYSSTGTHTSPINDLREPLLEVQTGQQEDSQRRRPYTWLGLAAKQHVAFSYLPSWSSSLPLKNHHTGGEEVRKIVFLLVNFASSTNTSPFVAFL